MKVYKYKLKMVDEQEIKVERFESILSINQQNNELVLYCLVSDVQDRRTMSITVYIAGTGNEIEVDHATQFLGTCSTHSNRLFWHVFYKLDFIGMMT
jgi:hypothetical protein